MDKKDTIKNLEYIANSPRREHGGNASQNREHIGRQLGETVEHYIARLPAKPADAYPAAAGAGAHTDWQSDGELVTTNEGEGFYCVDTVHAQFAVKRHQETAAERDRLKERIGTLVTFADARIGGLERERDQAREQVKTCRQAIVEAMTVKRDLRCSNGMFQSNVLRGALKSTEAQ